MSDQSLDHPETWLSGREWWTGRVGQISTGRPNIPAGARYYMAYQKGSGKNKNSGPTGKRCKRFYQGRAGAAHAPVKRRQHVRAA